MNDMNGAALIAAERRRQIEVEGWTPEHDAEHVVDDLARAAACYAVPSRRGRTRNMSKGTGRPDRFVSYPEGWPFSPDDWKPTPNDRVRELVKAGALIAAEIDRLQAAPEAAS